MAILTVLAKITSTKSIKAAKQERLDLKHNSKRAAASSNYPSQTTHWQLPINFACITNEWPSDGDPTKEYRS